MKSLNLDEEVAYCRDLLAQYPPGHPDRFDPLRDLAGVLSLRFEDLGVLKDLDEAIICYEDALNILPPDHSDGGAVIFDAATALQYRYNKLGFIEDLDLSISRYRDCVRLCPSGHLYRPWSLHNLALVLQKRYERQGGINDLEEAILYNREALELRPPGHPYRERSLHNLSVALQNRYEQKGSMDDLEDGIKYNRELLGLLPNGHPNQLRSINNLAIAYEARHHHFGAVDDLHAAIFLHRESLALRPPGHEHRSTSLTNLANVLRTRYFVNGNVEDLESAISYNRESLYLRPTGHPGRAASLNNLANVLCTRYQIQGSIDDLEVAISLHRESLTLQSPGHPDRPKCLCNLANALETRYLKRGAVEDLEECILCHRESLSLRPLGHPDRSDSLQNLGAALHNRYENGNKGSKEDLEEAILLNREALAHCPPSHFRRSSSLGNLAMTLETRYETEGALTDLEEAIALYRESLGIRPPGHPDRSSSLLHLAYFLGRRFIHSQNPDDVQESFRLYAEAATDATSFLPHRLESAIGWMEQARVYQHDSLLESCRAALHLLNRSLINRGDVESQQRFLATTIVPKYLASDAAASVISIGNLQATVELLEQGRAILWSKVSAYKDPLEDLRQVDEGIELADRLESINSQLERLILKSQGSTLETQNSSWETVLDTQMRRHRILSEEWEQVVDEIRQLEGFENFLQTPPYATLQTVASEGPVILVNISVHRCDAVILVRGGTPVLVPLPHVDRMYLIDQAGKLRSPTENVRMLRELWDTIVSPVIDRLGDLGVPHKSRIWWCPTSELCTLPIHAAGSYRRGAKNLPDIYISSYTSTLFSLIKARINIDQLPRIPKLLLVCNPGKDLLKVYDEVAVIQQHGDHISLLLQSRATCRNVLSRLKEHTWVHFACHGNLGDENQPFRASFKLYDKRLTLLDLMRAKLPNAELAFLSACHSAAGDSHTPNENIHLSAALQFCGFRSVVGTLWEMHDEDGPTISKGFYDYMFRNGPMADFKDSAEALNVAVRTMRKNGVPLERWIMFVHIGA
ncbi:hypothetical protein JR316_0000031 [Psilocybe cubensis]|uniref:Uncharacterized protein n=2 Tax=Psilocybe cubensis TaxID=181762 RepID=A0ACB8HE14_PSICU|nr:hypothetical protein JR316_0000031 [Psilocybe cubensis]KAH9485970.1 hypothetical protein JR316_0000031 [Psilocybe cubensis]